MLYAGVGLVAAIAFYVTVAHYLRKPKAGVLTVSRPTIDDLIHESRMAQDTARDLVIDLLSKGEGQVRINGITYGVRCSRS